MRPDKIRAEINHTMTGIKKMIGEASCTSDQQCRTIAIGEKACGGPQAFLAYSNDQTNSEKLNKMASKHRQLTKRLNKITGARSNCLFLSAPKTICTKNQCRV